eukprot:SAG31_NODE_20146_length_582_cov_1.277433_1_plen_38_part_10
MLAVLSVLNLVRHLHFLIKNCVKLYNRRAAREGRVFKV